MIDENSEHNTFNKNVLINSILLVLSFIELIEDIESVAQVVNKCGKVMRACSCMCVCVPEAIYRAHMFILG